MEQPPGYVAQGETKVCRLKKTIYGLKQIETLTLQRHWEGIVRISQC